MIGDICYVSMRSSHIRWESCGFACSVLCELAFITEYSIN